VERVALADGAPAKKDDGVKSPQVLRLDRGARIWKGRAIAVLEDLAEGQVVQMNVGWVALLGSTKEDGLCREIWIDEESRTVAAEQQRQSYLAQMKRRGIPATILETRKRPWRGREWLCHLCLSCRNRSGIDRGVRAEDRSDGLGRRADPSGI